jgi:hypothetical protein
MDSPAILEYFLPLFFILIFLGCGISLIYGTIKKWPMLVDPPERMWIYYSHSLFKKIFGKEFLIYFNYLFGGIVVTIGIYGVAEILREIYKIITSG